MKTSFNIIDKIIKLGLKKQLNSKISSLETVVEDFNLNSYPSDDSIDINTLIMLALDDGLPIIRTNPLKENYSPNTFIITNQDGTKKYGFSIITYCRLDDKTGTSHVYIPNIYILVLNYPHIEFGIKLIQFIETHLYHGMNDQFYLESTILFYMENLYQPMNGHVYIWPIPKPLLHDTITDNTHHFEYIPIEAYSKNSLKYTGFKYENFFSLLDIEIIIQLIRSIFLERKIIIMSRNKHILLTVCECLLGIIHPFIWPFAYIPLLPHGQLDFLDVPQPFIIGIMNHDRFSDDYRESIVEQFNDHDHVILDVDSNVLVTNDQGKPSLPFHDELKFRWEQILKTKSFKDIIKDGIEHNASSVINHIGDIECESNISGKWQNFCRTSKFGDHKQSSIKSMMECMNNSDLNMNVDHSNDHIYYIDEMIWSLIVCMLSLIKRFPLFIYGNNDSKEKEIKSLQQSLLFDVASFIADIPDNQRTFLVNFIFSQMFSNLIDTLSSLVGNHDMKTKRSSLISDMTSHNYEKKVLSYNYNEKNTHNKDLIFSIISLILNKEYEYFCNNYEFSLKSTSLLNLDTFNKTDFNKSKLYSYYDLHSSVIRILCMKNPKLSKIFELSSNIYDDYLKVCKTPKILGQTNEIDLIFFQTSKSSISHTDVEKYKKVVSSTTKDEIPIDKTHKNLPIERKKLHRLSIADSKKDIELIDLLGFSVKNLLKQTQEQYRSTVNNNSLFISNVPCNIFCKIGMEFDHMLIITRIVDLIDMIFNCNNNSECSYTDQPIFEIYILRLVENLNKSKRKSLNTMLSTGFSEENLFYGIWENLNSIVDFRLRNADELIHDFNHVNKIPTIKSKIGTVRAWIRFNIENKSLLKYMINLTSNHSFYKAKYKNSSYVRNIDFMEHFLKIISSLRHVNIYSFTDNYGGLGTKYSICLEFIINSKLSLQKTYSKENQLNYFLKKTIKNGIWLRLGGSLNHSEVYIIEKEEISKGLKDGNFKIDIGNDRILLKFHIIGLSVGYLNSIRIGCINLKSNEVAGKSMYLNSVNIHEHLSFRYYTFFKRNGIQLFNELVMINDSFIEVDSPKTLKGDDKKDIKLSSKRRLSTMFLRKKIHKSFFNNHYDIFTKLLYNYDRISSLVNGFKYYKGWHVHSNKNNWQYYYLSYAQIVAGDDGLLDIVEQLFKKNDDINSVKGPFLWNQILYVFRKIESRGCSIGDEKIMDINSFEKFIETTKELIDLILSQLCPYDLCAIWLSRAISNSMLSEWIAFISLDCFIYNQDYPLLNDHESKSIILHFLDLIDVTVKQIKERHWIDANIHRTSLKF